MKTRPEQWAVILDFLEEHPELVTNKYVGHTGDRLNVNKLWQSLTTQLNCMGFGIKSTEKWKEVKMKCMFIREICFYLCNKICIITLISGLTLAILILFVVLGHQ